MTRIAPFATTRAAILAVGEALDDLGITPTEVAAALIKRRCRGQPSNGSKCPLSKYITKRFRSLVVATVFPRYIRCAQLNCEDEFLVPLPLACRMFVIRFDGWKYPALISASYLRLAESRRTKQ